MTNSLIHDTAGNRLKLTETRLQQIDNVVGRYYVLLKYLINKPSVVFITNADPSDPHHAHSTYAAVNPLARKIGCASFSAKDWKTIMTAAARHRKTRTQKQVKR